MKLVINSKGVYLHKHEAKRKRLNKKKVKSFTEWRQTQAGNSSFHIESDIHEECMRLIGLPIAVDESDVEPILEGGGLFSEVLSFKNTPVIYASRKRRRIPQRQAESEEEENGENIPNGSDNNGIRVKQEPNEMASNDNTTVNDKTKERPFNIDSATTTFLPKYIDEDERSMNSNDESVTVVNAPENDVININDDSVDLFNSPNIDLYDFENEMITNDDTFKKTNDAKGETSNFCFNNEDNDISNNNESKDKQLNTKDADKSDLLNTNEENNPMPFNDNLNDNTMPNNDISNNNVINDAAKEDLLNDEEDDNLNSVLDDIETENKVSNSAIKDKSSTDHKMNESHENTPKNNDKLNKDNNWNTTNDSDSFDLIKEIDDILDNIVDNATEIKSTDITDKKDEVINIENVKDEEQLVKDTELIDLTYLSESQENISIDLTSCFKEHNKVNKNADFIDLTCFDDKGLLDKTKAKETFRELNCFDEDKVLLDKSSSGEQNKLLDIIKDEQRILLDIIKIEQGMKVDNNGQVKMEIDIKNEPQPSTSGMNVTIKTEKPDTKGITKMEIEPQPSTSTADASFMSRVRRRGKRKREGDGEEEEEEQPNKPTKTKARMHYISMDDLAKDIDDDEENDEEMSVAQTYSEYKPRKLNIGRSHPDPVVETASLSSVEPADVTYKLSLPDDVITNGLLSALQLEAVVYASQAHQKILPDRSRAGFLIGDGAGVGKGRTVAGIAFDNYLQGRRRALWFSVSRDLKYDAERDLRDIGAQHITAYNIIDMKYDDDISSEVNDNITEGVIFSTYSALVSKNNSGCKYSSRLEQLLQWCGEDFDGVIIFDECHKAKNLHTAHTQTGQNVLELQMRLPQARVVYASATGASEPHNMAYMVRLGIWGEGTPFKDFGEFNSAVEKRGVSAMELVAMDIKQRGVYIARQLSFHDVSYQIKHIPMSAQLKLVYNESTQLWSKARIKFIAGIELNSLTLTKKGIGNIWRQFWGTHQRFFKYLCIAAKVEAAVNEALSAVKSGKCAVIGLQATGEARTIEIIKNTDADHLTDFISTAEGVFQALVEKQFPTADYPRKKMRRLSENPSALTESERMQAELLSDIKKLGPRLPKNTLDELVDKLGGASKVAEMTGRVGRLVKNKDGAYIYESRTWGLIKQENVNMAEKQLFMDGKKDIAIISEAASSGISLQSDRRAVNKKRRVHITLELPWSADQAVQQFGRTHRSNQVNAPEYIFLISDLAGERRFASTVAKRLESLGALTHGDRRATDTRDLSQFNIDNKYGRLALNKMMNAITGKDEGDRVLVKPPSDSFINDVTQALREVQFYEEKNYDTSVFLNRMLGIPVDLQNVLFKYFTDTLAAVIQLAKRNGKFDMGILDLDSSSRSVQQIACKQFTREHSTGTALVHLHTVISERGIDWRNAEKIANSKSGHNRTFYRLRTGTKNKPIVMCIAVSTTDDQSLQWIYSPITGQAKETQLLDDIKFTHSKVNRIETARNVWEEQYKHALKSCRHEQCRNRTVCEFSRTVRTYYVLSGSLLTVWKQVEDLLLSGRLLSTKQRASAAVMKVVRVNTDGLKIIGILIPKKYVVRLQEELSRDPKDYPPAPATQTKQQLDRKLLLPSHSKENMTTNVQPSNILPDFWKDKNWVNMLNL